MREGEMEEQPVPRDDRWPWSAAFWGFRLSGATRFVSVRILDGIRDWCAQCGQTILAEKIACVVTLKRGERYKRLHFHRACYSAWERMERSPPVPRADKVVPLPVHRSKAVQAPPMHGDSL
jgi:hypothetical protein